MKTSSLLTFLIIAIIACWAAAGCSQLEPASVGKAKSSTTRLTVSAAASLQDALEAIDPLFEQTHSTIHVDAGLVYATDAKLSDSVETVAIAPAGSHSAIVYPIAVLTTSARVETATTYIDFLADSQAQAVFENFGFGKI